MAAILNLKLAYLLINDIDSDIEIWFSKSEREKGKNLTKSCQGERLDHFRISCYIY